MTASVPTGGKTVATRLKWGGPRTGARTEGPGGGTLEAAADSIATPGRVGMPCERVAATAGPAPGRLAVATATALLILLAGAPSDALAVDWRVSGSLSTRLEADTNRDLEGDPDPIYGTTARLGLQAAAITAKSFLAVQTGVSARAFGGSGDTSGLNTTNPDLRGEYAYNGKYFDAGANVSVQYEPVAFAQIDDTGVTEGDALQLSIRSGSYVGFALTPRDRLNAGANVSLVRFTKGSTDLNPTTTIGGSLGWAHSISPTTSLNTSFGARHFTSDGNESEERLTFDLTTGLGHQFNRRLSVQGGAGISATEDDGYTIGAIGNFSLAWQPVEDTSFSFAFHHGVEPSSIGTLRTSTSAGIGLAHQVNSWTDLGFSLSWSRRSGIDGDTSSRREDERDLIRFGSTIDFAIARAWGLGFGYALTLSSDDDGDAVGNRVFMQLTRHFDIIP